MDKVSERRRETTRETTRLGSYEVIRKLARGGMAELFLARGPADTDRVVVLKKILPRYADSPRMVQLFLDEAKLAGSLEHPHIVKAYEAGKDVGQLYFAMEYLHGQDVRTILHRSWQLREKVPLRHAVQIARQVATALHYAHEKRGPDGSLMNVVHRDVSPSNIVVSYDGAVKLLDFGVAKATGNTVKTRTGTLKGKISYMSPEQAKGAPIDRRSDIFSLGIVLWEMVTTQRLFKGENDLATLQLIINQPPRRPSLIQPACPPELERVVTRALAQDVAVRYSTADELARELEVVSDQLGPADEPIAGFLARLFATEVRSWQDARAVGIPLAEHLTGGGELTIQVSQSDFVDAVELEDLDDPYDDPSVDYIESVGPPAAVATGTIPPPRPPSPSLGHGRPPSGGALDCAVHELPTVITSDFAVGAEPAPALPPNPWTIASGSNISQSGSDASSQPRPAPFQLDPAVAARAIRRALQVGAAIVALIVAVAIVKGCGNARADRAGPAQTSRP